MRLSILGSGSSGSAIYLEHEGAALLVDAGLDPAEVRRRASGAALVAPPVPAAVLISHEHRAHAEHAAAYAALGVGLRGSAGTVQALGEAGVASSALGTLEPEETIGPFRVTSVPVPHGGAAEPTAFIIDGPGGRVGILTDCGHPSPKVAEAFTQVNALLLETHHDADLLRAAPYPPALRRKLGGRLGHLSNDDAAAMLRTIGRPFPRVIVLCHLSRVANRPRLARLAIERVLAGASVALDVAPAAGPGPEIAFVPGRAPRLWPAQRQLFLPLERLDATAPSPVGDVAQ
jgi:phosphoribosyl 1,2-cyclic phosphodiesterase